MKIRSLLIALALGMHGTAFSQLESTDKNKLGDVIELEEFTVFGEQQSYFEQARSTAMKMDVGDMQTPFSISVVNAAMLEDLKANTLEDAYPYISSFSRSGTNANSFTIRGHTADLQNLQVDGLPGLVSRFGSPVTANIERVEILKGPASVLYGWMDPGGMVNIITKKAEADSGTNIDFTYQFFIDQEEPGIEGSIDTGGSFNGSGTFNYRVVLGFEKEDSFRNFVENDTFYFFPSFSWIVSEDTRIDLQLEYLKEERSADNGLFVANQEIDTIADIETYYQEPGDYDNDDGFALAWSLEHRFNETVKASVKFRSVQHEDDRHLYESNAVIQGDTVEETTLRRRNRHQFNERDYNYLDANVSFVFGGDITHEALVGVNAGYEFRRFDRLAFDTRGANVTIYNPQYTGYILEDDPQSFRSWNLFNYGAYAFDKISFGENWTVVVGTRFDKQDGDYSVYYLDLDTTDSQETTSSSTTFNGGLVYQINHKVSAYASWAESFNPQSVGSFDINREQLDAEGGEQFEVGVKVSLLDNTVNLNVSYFDVVKNNLSEENPETGFDELIGEISSSGVELNFQYQPTETLQFQFGYTYLDSEISDTYNEDSAGNSAPFAPKNNVFFFGRYNHPQEVFGGLVGASLGLKYESERYTDEETSKRVLLPSYSLVDIGLYYEVNSFKYGLNFSNVTNETYYVGGTNDYRIYAGQPQKVSFSVSYDF
ncbi:TonB-dependent siderophore receptor [Puniceicoccaceae bacterium K14]|nr:TonB-dependent siderophore receptor [Puniceicoccaceae bacterium K14]